MFTSFKMHIHPADIKNILSGFEPITLEEMDNVRLMNRTDLKFTFSLDLLPSVLGAIRPCYRVLEVSGTRISKYETLYYDTNDFELYGRHHCGKMNRYKIRSRKYLESNLQFFEVKYKSNKGRTIKNRITIKNIEDKLSGRSSNLLLEKTSIDPASLRAVLWVNYSRITLVSKFSNERLTIDIDLHYISGSRRENIHNLVIAEVKQDKADSLSPVISAMKEKRIKEGSISKYCLGVASMFDHIRKNNFKEKIRNIKKCTYAA